MTLTQRTVLTRWRRGESDTWECPSCGGCGGPGPDRAILYAARRHAVATGHVVWMTRTHARDVIPTTWPGGPATLHGAGVRR